MKFGIDGNDYDFEVVEMDEALGKLNGWDEMLKPGLETKIVCMGFGISIK